MPQRRTVERARGLRRMMTLPEVKLWPVLRTRPGGFRFRRQHPLGPYVLDFYCAEARLAVEVDGLAHELGSGPTRDAARDGTLAASGVATLRIAASAVLGDVDAVVALIVGRCGSLALAPLHRPADGPPPHAAHGEDEWRFGR